MKPQQFIKDNKKCIGHINSISKGGKQLKSGQDQHKGIPD